jgi:hypothetical protein
MGEWGSTETDSIAPAFAYYKQTPDCEYDFNFDLVHVTGTLCSVNSCTYTPSTDASYPPEISVALPAGDVTINKCDPVGMTGGASDTSCTSPVDF